MNLIARLCQGLARFATSLLAISVILMVVYNAAGQAFINALPSFKQDIEHKVYEKLNRKISIGSMEGHWHWLRPTLFLKDISFQDQTLRHEDAPRLGRANVQINLLSSLLAKKPQLGRFEFSGLELAINIDENNKMTVPGFEHLDQGATPNPESMNNLFHTLFSQHSLFITDYSIRITTPAGTDMVAGTNFSLGKRDQKNLVSTELWLEQSGSAMAISVAAEIYSDKPVWSQNRANVYLKIEQGDLAPWIKQYLPRLTALHALSVRGDAWLHTDQGDLKEFLLRLDNADISLTKAERQSPVVLSGLGIEISGAREDAGWRIEGRDFGFNFQKQSVRGLNALIHYKPLTSMLSVQLDRLPLAPLARMGAAFGGAESELASLTAAGELKAVGVLFDGHDFDLDAFAEAISIGVGKRSITGIYGVVNANRRGGGLELHSEVPVEVVLDPLFRQPLVLDELSGNVRWRLSPSLFELETGLIKLRNSDVHGQAMLRFRKPLTVASQAVNDAIDSINEPVEQEGEGGALVSDIGADTVSSDVTETGVAPKKDMRGQLSLVGSVWDGVGTNTSKYLPTTLRPNLIKWLDDGIQDGRLVQGDFLYNGPVGVNKSFLQEHTFQMRFAVDQATLDYKPGWPLLHELDTQVLITNREIWAHVYGARVSDTAVLPSNVFIEPGVNRGERFLKVRAEAAGVLKDGWRVLLESPVGPLLPEFVRGIKGDGGLSLALHLDVPLHRALPETGHRLHVKSTATVSEADIDFQPIDLMLRNVKGAVHYHLEEGLSSDRLTGLVDGLLIYAKIRSVHGDLPKPLKIERISGEASNSETDTPDDHSGNALENAEQFVKAEATLSEPKKQLRPQWLSTVIQFGGQMEIAKLNAWRPNSWLNLLEGRSTYNAEIHLNREPRPVLGRYFLELHSEMEGVEINLPEPLAKRKAEKRPLFYQMSFSGATRYTAIQLGTEFSSVFESAADSAQIDRAKIHFGPEQAKLLDRDGIVINGAFNRLSLSEWLNITKAMGEASEDDTGSFLDRIRWVDLNVGDLDIFGLQLRDVSGQFLLSQDNWSLSLQNDRIALYTKVPDAMLTKLSTINFQAERDDLTPWIGFIDPIEAELQYLKWPLLGASEEMDSEVVDASNEIQEQLEARANIAEPNVGDDLQEPNTPFQLDPRLLPPINLAVKQFTRNDEDWGEWNVSVQPEVDGLELVSIRGGLRGIDVALQGRWRWQQGEPVTAVEGQLKVADISQVMQAWDYTPNMTSRDGRLNLELQWPDSPFGFAVERTTGMVDLLLEDGELLEVDPAASSVRVIGLLNVHTLQRRLQLDFSDLFNKGLAYDKIFGRFTVDRGLLSTPRLKVEGPSAQFELMGNTDLVNKEVDQVLRVTLPVSRNLVLPAAAAGGLPLAATAYLVERALGDQLDKLTTFSMRVVGDWGDPKFAPESEIEESEEFDVFDDE